MTWLGPEVEIWKGFLCLDWSVAFTKWLQLAKCHKQSHEMKGSILPERSQTTKPPNNISWINKEMPFYPIGGWWLLNFVDRIKRWQTMICNCNFSVSNLMLFFSLTCFLLNPDGHFYLFWFLFTPSHSIFAVEGN